MAFKMHTLHFKSPDPQKTARWYVDNLGAKLLSESEMAGGTIRCELDLHGVPMLITAFIQGQKLEQHYGLEHVGLFTDDLPGMIEQIKARGSRILEERRTQYGDDCCFIEGPEGILLELTQKAV